VAILQASIVSVATFLVIFWAAVAFGLDRRLAATLGAGGAVCGVSATIAIAGAVGARKDAAPIAITSVILWAIVMIFVLPLTSRMLHLPAGVAGAWIGTSDLPTRLALRQHKRMPPLSVKMASPDVPIKPFKPSR
jgi:uncharacterized membrane protein YadS